MVTYVELVDQKKLSKNIYIYLFFSPQILEYLVII